MAFIYVVPDGQFHAIFAKLHNLVLLRSGDSFVVGFLRSEPQKLTKMAPTKQKIDQESFVQAIVYVYNNNNTSILQVVKKYSVPLRALKKAVEELIEINQI